MIKKSIDISGETLSIETGRLANQASGSVLVTSNYNGQDVSCNGSADAIDTPIGKMPTLDGIDINGLEMNEADKASLLRVDVEGWLQELPGIEEYYDSFGNHLPEELRQQIKALKKRLESTQQAVA